MLRIAHRGNFEGKRPELENHPSYIAAALEQGYSVEIDIRFHQNKLFLGHDNPQYPLDTDLVYDNRIWCHAKDDASFDILLDMHWTGKNKVRVFSHDKDNFALTSLGEVWANAGIMCEFGIMVLPELFPDIVNSINNRQLFPFGICCDDFGAFTNEDSIRY
jgi:hypothetical protein